jgi:tetratricopeptide (TPR) repeat protein
MNDIRKNHEEAMALAERADLLKMAGNHEEAKKIYEKAFELEKLSATLAITNSSSEPAKAVLLKSSAYLAITCGKIREAEKLIAQALLGEPPADIADELRNLLEEVNFSRHLNVNGVKLDDDEFQFVISGPRVGYGIANSKDIWERIKTLQQLAMRTADRLMKKPFGKISGSGKDIASLFDAYVSIPRAASYAVTIKMGKQDQLVLPGISGTMDVISDVVGNIELISKGADDKLKDSFINTDPEYLSNFISLAKKVAPDGKNIKLVGFTIQQKGVERKVEFTRIKEEFVKIENFHKDKEEVIEQIVSITGRLTQANADKNIIKVTPNDGKGTQIVVPVGLGDIVRSYWDEEVKVTFTKEGKKNVLAAIDDIN